MPRKPKEPTRTVSFRLTLPDHAAYLAKASAAGVKPSEFFRDAVLTNRTQVVARVQPSSDKRRLIYLFNKASNNLNQLAHTANAAELAGTVTPATYTGILAELQTLADLMKEAIRDADSSAWRRCLNKRVFRERTKTRSGLQPRRAGRARYFVW